LIRKSGLLLAVLLLGGCQTTGDGARLAEWGGKPAVGRPGFALPAMKAVDPDKLTTQQRVVYEGIKALHGSDYAKASRLFNVALKMDVTRSELHLLNAITYHLMAMEGDGSKYELADEGYRLAIKFDESSWLAHYYYGLCNLDQRKFEAAQEHFANAAAIENSDPDLLYDLAVASYYAHDPRIADGALRRLAAVDPDFAARPMVLRAQAFVRAALNDHTGAAASLDKLRAASADADVRLVERRLGDWGAFYKTTADASRPIQLAGGAYPVTDGFNTGGTAYPAATPSYPSAAYPANAGYPAAQPYGNNAQGAYAGSPSQFVEDKMVVVDVVLIGTQEDNRNTYGINLLNGLKLQFGDSTTLDPGISKARNRTTTVTDGVVSTETTKTITSLVRIPSVTYSLNIANAIDGQDEVIAKPSLVALSGQTSEFFSGVEISAAAVSGGAGDSISIQKEIGVKLSVRPDFLPNNKVRLQVSAQRTFLTDPSNSVVFTYRLDTTKTNVNSNVVLKFGETLILSGLTEREVTKSSNGVPFLRDIPGLNLLFSEHGKRDYQKSILVLLTPRRPVYTAQAPEDRQALLDGMSEYERSVERLEQRNKDWFPHQPAFEDIRKQIDSNNFFREFRTGDVRMERWDKRESNQQHLAQALDELI
jgi:tetratricopeptide (TPR) repeat protein